MFSKRTEGFKINGEEVKMGKMASVHTIETKWTAWAAADVKEITATKPLLLLGLATDVLGGRALPS
jgi:hypothetical protein